MEFEEPSKKLEEDLDIDPEELGSDLNVNESLDFNEDTEADASLSEIEALEKGKGRSKQANHMLKVRRAIEDYLERKRLKDELDYLIDDEDLEPLDLVKKKKKKKKR